MALKDVSPAWAVSAGKRLRGLPVWISRPAARHARLAERLRQPRTPVTFPSRAQAATYRDVLSPYFLLKLELMEHEAAAAGRELRHPFLDSRLIEFILAVPWHQRCHDGERKWLLRHATQESLPAAIRRRRGKGDGTPGMDEALVALCQGSRPAPLANRSGMLQRYVDLHGARVLVDRYAHGAHRYRWDIWSLIALDHWLDQFWNRGGRDAGEPFTIQTAVHAADVTLVR